MSHRGRQTARVKNILSLWSAGTETVACFGTATLHRARSGRYELQGGSASDRADALEWASLFQHDAVISHQPDRARSALPAPSPR